MISYLRPALVLLVFFTVLTGIAYPLAVTGVTQVALPAKANGTLVRRNGAVVGSALVGQAFTSERYFHGRPSATSAADPKDDSKTVDAPYNAASSGGANLGPLSKKLLERVAGDIDTLRKDGAKTIPADAVTTSASGLDPHISPAFASVQIERVAKARNVAPERIRAIIEQTTEYPLLGFIGEPRVNVLMLNLGLDAAIPGAAG